MSWALLNGVCSVPMSMFLLEERLMTMLFDLKTIGKFSHFLKLKEPFSVKQCHSCPLFGNGGQHPHKTLQILVWCLVQCLHDFVVGLDWCGYKR